MAKKLGKLLLLSAAIGSVVGAVCYYMQKKDNAQHDGEEDDYDDFSEDLEEDSESSRSYVPLNSETAAEKTPETDTETASTEGASPETSSKEAEEAFFEETSSEETPSAENSSAAGQAENTFTPLTEQAAKAAENAEEAVEEFFDEEDAPGMEPPINDN